MSFIDQLPDVEAVKVFDVRKAAAAALIDTQKKVNRPPTILSIRQGTREIKLCTLGNLSVVSGKAKSRKTFLTTMLTAAAISGGYIAESIRGTLPEGKRGILYLDTEQSEYDAQAAVKRALVLSGVEQDPLFKPAMIQDYTTEQRKELLEHYIHTTPELGLIVLDGVRDFVNSINDEVECKKFVDWLMMLRTKHYLHIICVIHENKVGGQIRGVLGTELQNKAETVISVEKVEGDNVSIVSARDTRGMPFEPFAVYYNEETKLPDIDHDYEIKPEKAKKGFQAPPKKKRLGDFTRAEHNQYLAEVFAYAERLSGRDLRANVSEVYSKYSDFYKKDAEAAAGFFLSAGILAGNQGEEKAGNKQNYWIHDEFKKEFSPF